MSEKSRDIFVDGRLVGKVVEHDHADGSHHTIVEKIHSRDFFGNDSATIVSETITDKNGNVSIKNH